MGDSMFLVGKPSDTIEQLINRISHLVRLLLEGFELSNTPITLEGVDDLYEHFDRDQFFLIQDGMLHLSKNGQNLVSFDEGDLIGIIHSFDLPLPVLRTDEYVPTRMPNAKWAERLPVAGKVIWITPKGAQNKRSQGIGVQFSEQDGGETQKKIESALAGGVDSDRPTYTM